MKNKALRAFTLTEMIIVMLITVVILGMVYTVFQLVSKTYSNFNAKNARVDDTERLEEWLRKDFQNASLIYLEGPMLMMKNDADSIRYDITDSLVIRQRIRTDTFRISVSGLSASFLGRPVDTVSRSPVDRLNLTIMLEGEAIPETFNKLYSSEQLMTLTDAIDRHQ